MTATIKEIPLIFQTEMVQAVMEDRKTQTRRTRGLESKNEHPDAWSRVGNPKRNICRLWDSTKEANPNPLCVEYGFKLVESPDADVVFQKCPYGKPGDLIWVRETWAKLEERYKDMSLLYQPEGFKYVFKADGVFMKNWKPSIHMPKSACRLWLMVEEIRVERLRGISEGDSVAEGVVEYEDGYFRNYFTKRGLRSTDGVECMTAISSFQTLICQINGLNIWDENPWVWVVKFRVLSKIGRPSDEAIQSAYQSVTSK